MIIMPDPAIAGPTTTAPGVMTLGALNLVHVNNHLDIPVIDGKDGAGGYLSSLSSSMRDLHEIKVTYLCVCACVCVVGRLKRRVCNEAGGWNKGSLHNIGRV